MTSRRPSLSAVLIGCIVVVWGLDRGSEFIRLGTAFAAKTLCSGLFVSGRAQRTVVHEDILPRLPLDWHVLRIEVSKKKRIVRASLMGLFSAEAVYRDGLGCTLAIETSAEALRNAGGGVAPTGPLPGNTAPWPHGETVPEEWRNSHVQRVIDEAFAEPESGPRKATRAIVVIHRGRIVAERYGTGFGAAMPLAGWSMSKSAMNALAGHLVGAGRMALDEDRLFPAWASEDDKRAQITIRNLLTMTSGLAFDPPDDVMITDAQRMHYLTGDSARYARSKSLDADPGTQWAYGSHATALLCRLMADAAGGTGAVAFAKFAREVLFDRLGMQSAVLETDASGTALGAAFLYASARDWGRLGLLYLHDGQWDGQRLLPEGWVEDSLQPTKGANGAYGAHLWLRVPNFLRPTDRPRPALPKGHFFILGRCGQMVAVVPAHDLVVVRMGLTRDREGWDHEAFLSAIIAALAGSRRTDG